MRRTQFVLIVAATTALSAPAHAQFECGLMEEMRPDETLEELAARCGTEPDEILRVNGADTAAELPEGRLKMPVVDQERVDNFLEGARNAMRDAGQRIEDAASSAGKSVSDYLSERPDLNRDIAEFGERIGLPGMSAEPSRGPDLLAQQIEDGRFTVEASGLPGEREVNVSLRRDNDLEVLETLETDTSGELSAEIELPPEALSEEAVVIVVETADGRVRLVSDAVVVD